MMQRQRLEVKIRQKEEEIQGLELSVREAKSYLQALQDMLKMFPKEGNISGSNVLRAGSDMAKSRDAIRAAGKALHVTEILAAIGKENTKKNRVAIGGSLAGYVRKGVIFNKTAPNTFGILEALLLAKTHDFSPPEGFGK